uniref:Putative secreted protein n=1 Tax=Ixodes ricinus TaxID=34613 RepID=A0A6B0UFI2_IXORI
MYFFCVFVYYLEVFLITRDRKEAVVEFYVDHKAMLRMGVCQLQLSQSMQYTKFELLGGSRHQRPNSKSKTYDEKLRMIKPEKKFVLTKHNCRNFCVTYNAIL